MTHQTGNYIIPYNETEAEEKPKHIRCRQCGKSAMENLVVCPYCGRELHPAPPRLLVWGVPVLVVLLFVITFTSWRDRNPLFWSTDRLEQGWMFLTNVGRQIEPRVALDAEPVREPQVVIENSEQQPLVVITAQPAPAIQVEQSQQNAASVEMQNGDAAQGTPLNTAEGAVEVSPPTETPAPPATNTIPAAQPAATATQRATSAVSNTPTSTATASPTAASPTAAPTNTPTNAPTNAPTATSTVAATAVTATRTAIESTGSPTATQIVIPTATALDGAASSARTATPTRAVSLAQLRAAQSPTPNSESAALSVSSAAVDATDRSAMAAAGSASDAGAGDAQSVDASAARATPAAATKTPTATPTPSPTFSPTPSPTPSPTATSTSVPFTYSVRTGDTLLAIARQFETTVNALMRVNGLSESDARALRPGQELIIPPESTVASAAAQGAANATRTYTVQSGDTPFAIATRFGVSVDALLTMNGLSRADATRLRTGQVLAIPDSGRSPAPTATASSASPSSVDPPNASDVATERETNYRLSAPTLRTPQDGAAIRCSGQYSLVWDPVPFITGTDKYILHLGYLNGVAGDGAEQIVWVLAQEREPSRSFWEMDNDLCALAPQELGRKWRWFVQVEDASANPVSPPSAIWSFSWN